MKTRKPHEGVAPTKVSTEPIPEDDGGAVIALPAKDNASAHRTLDLTPYLGHGIDDWVWAGVTQLRTVLAGKTVTPATVASYWRDGLTYFFDFLIAAGLPCQPSTLEKKHLVAYIDWLKGHGDWAYGTQKSRYSFIPTSRRWSAR